MKKIIGIFSICFTLFLINGSHVQAEIAQYPFDSITITSAFTFDVLIENPPQSESVLYGNVNSGETLSVYVGTLEFIDDGQVVSGSSKIIILTNENDEDFVSWLVNSTSSDLSTYENAYFASWILIDPEIGVIKDDQLVEMQVGYEKDLTTSNYTFIDNLNNPYQMIANTYQEESNLDILISAYEGSD